MKNTTQKPMLGILFLGHSETRQRYRAVLEEYEVTATLNDLNSLPDDRVLKCGERSFHCCNDNPKNHFLPLHRKFEVIFFN